MRANYRKIIRITEEGPFPLELGGQLADVELAYETYGSLNARGDNAVLVCHALTGDAHVASHSQDDLPGWWEGLVGEGRPLDTRRFFVVCSNVLGGCYGSTGPSSVNPQTGKAWGLDFPILTIRDMVRAQYLLCQKLGIKKLALVIGGSLGGMQALEWAVTYPEFVGGLAAIATGPVATAQQIALGELGRWAIMLDPAWEKGSYGEPGPEGGLGLARMIAMVSYKSPELFAARFGRKWQGGIPAKIRILGHDSPWAEGFQVESYLHYQGKKLVDRFDANCYLYLTRAMDYHDISKPYGSFEKAVARIKCPVLVVGLSSDQLYLPQEQIQLAELCRRAGLETSFQMLDTPFGHDGFLVEIEAIGKLVTEFLC
ncbi:MAG: homoserine O-acetyltransferase [Firmicutes bacterium]|nr:homoserine O-acetyltransferase [Bacillota bacterium]